jgi:outer membrane protein assembly factor BamD (BamD/ComL family)
MFYYRLAADSTSADDTERSRYLFAQARLIRPADTDAADSLLEIISERYPTSPYGRQASGDLGFSSDVVIDDAAELYKSATSFRLIKDYSVAASRYNAIVRDHSTSHFAPKALYALGWMHERETGMQDSAMYYYSELVDKYPRSEHAKEIRPSLEFALAKINGVEVQDSLLLRDLDKDLLEKAKAGERDAMQQLMDNNRDVLNPNMPNLPGLNVPGLNVPGLNNPGGTPPGNLPPGNLPPGSVPPGSVPGGKGVPGGGVKPMQDGTPPADTSGAKRP